MMEQDNNSGVTDNNENLFSEEKIVVEPTKTKEGTKQCPLRPSTILNVVLFLAIAVLYVLHFYTPKSDTSQKSALTGTSSKIAFFNTDSVFQNYELVTVLRDELKRERERLEGALNGKQAAFQKKVNNYQINIKNNSVTPVQAQNAEAQLMKERDEIMKLNDEYTQQFALKEAEIQRKITDDIIGYANKFNEKYGADYILGYAKGGPVIVANPKMDVTKEITEGLNDSYRQNKDTK